MAAIRIALRWIAWLALGLFAIAALLWIIARITQPTPAQREAIAVLDRKPEFPGSNAFGLLWTLNREVPVAEIDDVLSKDARAINAATERFDGFNADEKPFHSAADAYPDLSLDEDDVALFCSDGEDDCLAQVRAKTDAYRDLIERNQVLLERIDALNDYGHVDQPWPYSMAMFGMLRFPSEARLSVVRNALWFVEGRHDDALAATCAGISTWRRLGHNGDSLLLRLLANAYAADHHGRLLAAMMAELPMDVPLPSACDAALEPPAAEQLSLCNAMRGEFEIIRDSQRWIGNADAGWWGSIGWALFYDAEASLGLAAAGHARHCRNEQIDLIRADSPASGRVDDEHALSPWRLACAGNVIGCTLFGIQVPAYDSYRLRMQDFGFKLKSLATLAWLRREQPGVPVTEALLQRRPEALRSETRELRIVEGGDALEAPLYGPGQKASWELPLPASRLGAPTGEIETPAQP